MSTEPDLTQNMQSTQPFQLKQVIQRVYNTLIMIRTSFLANFKLTVRYKQFNRSLWCSRTFHKGSVTPPASDQRTTNSKVT